MSALTDDEETRRWALVNDLFFAVPIPGLSDAHAKANCLFVLRSAVSTMNEEQAQSALRETISRSVQPQFREGVLTQLMTFYRQVVAPRMEAAACDYPNCYAVGIETVNEQTLCAYHAQEYRDFLRDQA